MDNLGENFHTECAEKSLFLDSISYLIYMKNPWKLTSTNPEETFKCLSKINELNFRFSDTFDYLSQDKKIEFIELIIDYMKYMYEHLSENLQKLGYLIPILPSNNNNSSNQLPPKIKFHQLIRESIRNNKKTNKDQTENYPINDSNNLLAVGANLNNELEIMHKVSLILWSWADKSSDFCIKIHEMKCIKILFKYLSNMSMISNLLDHVRVNNNYFKLALAYRAILGTVHNLSKYKEAFDSEWDNNLFSSLLDLSGKFAGRFPNLDIQLLAYFPVLNLFNKASNRIEQLVDIKDILKRIIDLVKIGSTRLALNENIQRRVYKSHEFNSPYFEVLVINSKDIMWRLTELLNFLIQLVELSDKFKHELYEHDSLNIYLNRILFNGNLIEKEHALKLLWKLSTDHRVAKHIMHDLDLYSYIIGLSVNSNNKDKNLLRYSNYILFTLNTSLSQTPSVKKVTYSTSNIYSSKSSNLNKFCTSYDDDEYLKI
jgi:hypothetical protein